MSRENVEVVRRAVEAWDVGGSESAKEFWAADIEWHDPPDLPDPRVVRGREAVAAYLTEQVNAVGDMDVTLVDARRRGGAVAIRLEITIHGATSGVDVPDEFAQVVDVADGRLRRVRLFRTWPEALEAAGLSE
jgi:ketosteroid isomerase-like protein